MKSEETIWILGGGRFGLRAVEQLRRADPRARIVLVEQQPATSLPNDIEVVHADAVAWLYESLIPTAVVHKIIPALPLHLVVEWLKYTFLAEERIFHTIDIPKELLHLFPNPYRISDSEVAVSHANFLCPPECSEPSERCTYTGLPRPLPLYDLLGEIEFGSFINLIVRSRQFAPGVGGFTPEDLSWLLKRVESLNESPLLIGTACKCHGVVSGVSFQ